MPNRPAASVSPIGTLFARLIAAWRWFALSLVEAIFTPISCYWHLAQNDHQLPSELPVEVSPTLEPTGKSILQIAKYHHVTSGSPRHRWLDKRPSGRHRAPSEGSRGRCIRAGARRTGGQGRRDCGATRAYCPAQHDGLPTLELGVENNQRRILDRDGRATVTGTCPQVFTAWERVYRLLRDAFPVDRYHRGTALAAFEQNGRGIVAHFADGRALQSGVLIGADGLRSTVRQQCLPDIKPLYAGYSGMARDDTGKRLPAASIANCSTRMTFWLPSGEQFLGYPVVGPDGDLRPGRRRYNIIWYRPADE